MNEEQKTIEDAYQSAVGRLYETLIQQLTDAAESIDLQNEAETHFTAGLQIARRARDRALVLIQ